MKLRVLGCYGGNTPGLGMTAFLVNDALALDAGWVSEALTLDEQARVKDILISHSPPKGVADRGSLGASLGSSAVRAAVERVQPNLCLCGHVHDSWGKSGFIGATAVHNLGPRANWFEV